MPNYPDELLDEIDQTAGLRAYQQDVEIDGKVETGLFMVNEDSIGQFMFSTYFVELEQ